MKTENFNCKCGHDIMLHGFQNMGCSVMVKGGDGKERKCPCSKFENI